MRKGIHPLSLLHNSYNGHPGHWHIHSIYFCSLNLSTTAPTLSSALSLTLLQSVSYTFFTDSSSTRFHLSLAISARPTGTSLATGSGSAGFGSMTLVRRFRCWRRSAAWVRRFLVCNEM